MKIRNKIFTSMLTLSLSFGVFFTSSSFAAEKDDIKLETKAIQIQKQKGYEIQRIKDEYSDKKVQDKLIEKVKKGQMLDSINPEKQALGVKEKINETTTITTYPDGSKEVSGVDYSQAKFYDDKGNEVERPQDSISGGTWTSGSGYACVKGAKVYRQNYGQFSAEYYADFCYHNGAYDKLDRVYGRIIDASGGSYSIENEGVFRTWETSTYSAYGGVKFNYTSSSGGSGTKYLYIRVGNDRSWEDTNI
ncbi:hypothetical protein ACEOWG_004598 [Bacillus cereus]